MNYLLTTHERAYGLSLSDCLFSLGTFGSGVPYAQRHWELAERSVEHGLGHRIVATLEAIPLIGSLFCLIERILALIIQEKPPSLITGRINQYQAGGQNAAICTSCAVAFLQNLKANAPVTGATIDRSIAQGRTIHERVNEATHSPVNTNFNAQQVLQHGGVGLREMRPSFTSRPTDANALSHHYETRLVPALLNPARKVGNLSCAILTKGPYSTALAYRHREGQFLLFDSHGERAADHKAFVRTFHESKSLCDYLARHYGYTDFPDIDYDLETRQDNPNNYELTFV